MQSVDKKTLDKEIDRVYTDPIAFTKENVNG